MKVAFQHTLQLQLQFQTTRTRICSFYQQPLLRPVNVVSHGEGARVSSAAACPAASGRLFAPPLHPAHLSTLPILPSIKKSFFCLSEEFYPGLYEHEDIKSVSKWICVDLYECVDSFWATFANTPL